ncbi:MAG TPA: peptidoglycan-binding protein, partial [Nevskiales bacterium]|nr:peptidoglycan-binding protein [Nevskiales bacterium]
ARGLLCLSGSGGWSELRRYDRPALLSLRLDSGEIREVLLRGLHGDDTVLEFPEGLRRVPRAELERFWAGDFLLVWRPASGEALIGPSTTGEPVLWLRRQLSLADGLPVLSGPGAERFDEELRRRVRAFQTGRGITADGLAGARTQILLGNLTPAADTPRLSAPEAG